MMNDMNTNTELDSCRDEIVRLTADIEELHRQKERLEWLSVGAVSYQQLCSKADEDISSDHVRIRQTHLSLMQMATGILLRDVAVEPCGDDGSVKYIVKGSSCGIVFEIQFQENNGCFKSGRQFHIINVEIDSMEIINSGLQDLLDLCEEQSSLGVFFSVFVPYVRYLANRRESFVGVKRKFPDLVDLSDGMGCATLKFSSSNKRALFEIHWTLKVSKTFLVQPILWLNVDAGHGDANVFDTASDMFTKMVEVMGRTRAVDAFTTAVCTGVKPEIAAI